MLEKLYRYKIVRRTKDALSPLKHKIFGLNGIYRAMGELGTADVIFDVGAASGIYTELFLNYFPKAKVYAFKPLQVGALKKRVERYQGRAKIFECALYDKSGEKELFISNNIDASSFLLKEDITGEKKIVVKTKMLDEFTGDIEKIDLIKIDVEGVELEILLGAKETLKKTRSVFVEINPAFKGFNSEDHIKVFELLHHNGFGFMGNYSGDYFFKKIT